MPFFPMTKSGSVSSDDEHTKHLSWTQRIKKGPTKKRKKKKGTLKNEKDNEESVSKETHVLKKKTGHSSNTRKCNLDAAYFKTFKEKDVYESEKLKLIEGCPRPQGKASPQKIWESRTPFVFTHGMYPPIAEAEETSLQGDKEKQARGRGK